MSVTYVKFCPQCKTTNPVDAPACVKCGRKFHTQFQPPVSEKTVAMDSASLPQIAREHGLAMPTPQPSAPARRPRRFVRKFIGLAVCAALAFAALHFGSHLARNAAVAPSVEHTTAFQPYTVVFQSDAQGYPVPLATKSADDLLRYKPAGADPASVGLYHAGRIVLVYPGTSAQVTEEGAGWRRVTLQSGSRKGLSGFVGGSAVQRTLDTARNPGSALPPPSKSSQP
ncbi:MAG: hypothetical protein M3Y28_04660 [Armatimonadota bacterium]|nr:hypothetical protein [Armatimonadota bacterium]